MAKKVTMRPGDIKIDLQNTSGLSEIVHSSLTDKVLSVWKDTFGSDVAEFRQESTLRSSVGYEIIIVTAKPGVDVRKLKRSLLGSAQTVIDDHFVDSTTARRR